MCWLLNLMSETLQLKFGEKIPWVMGEVIRIPKVKFPEAREGSLSLPTPGKSLILILTYVFLFYLVLGGIYIGIRDTVTVGGDAQGNAIFLYPTTNEAFIIESLVAGFLIYIAGLGFLLLYNATKHSFNYGYAIKIYILGAFLAFAGFSILQYMIGVKSGKIET
nr:OST3 / OST6 family protein [Candidatus Prometheoarchaeum syntrophicum]